jgi:choline dehydrogenase-like flavoprotein
VKGVTWRVGRTGEVHTEDARVVVLAGGCTETPRLWLNSGLPNPNGWVGRGYTDHFFDWVVGEFPFETGSYKGVGSSARVDFPGRGGLENVGLPPALQAFSALFSDSGIRGRYTNGLGRKGRWDAAEGRLVGNAMRKLVENLDHLLNVLVITDDDVEAQNRVTLSAVFPADEHGPVPKVEFHQRTRTRRTLANREYLANRAADLLRGAGATKIHRIGWPPLILHVQSTMRMGVDEADSVLDADAESRAVKRLFVADTSALANGLGGPNPTLTAQALATRTSERIFRRYFGGSPWVGHEAPVSSIDDRVTAAVFRRDIADAPRSAQRRPRRRRRRRREPRFTG